MNRKTFLIVLVIFFAISLSAYPSKLIVNVAAPLGPDNTADVQAALDQCVGYSGPGCTVQLAAGIYKTKQLFAKDFHGTFKGRGMDVTIIQALPNLPVSQEQPIVWNSPPSVDNHYPMLVLFFGGDISVSDMTIRALEPNQLEEWNIVEGERTTYMWALLDFMGQSEKMNVVVTRVELQGAYDESGPAYSDHYNATGLSLDPYPTLYHPSPGYLSGTFRISACRFDTFVEGIAAGFLREAPLTIGGSPSEANLIQNCDYGAVLINLDSSVVNFSHNDVSVVGPSAFGGIVAYQSPELGSIETPTSFLIDHNSFKAHGSSESGIAILDLFGAGKTADVVISNNEIFIQPSENGPAFAGIQNVFTEGTVISNNRIVGSGLFGIVLFGDTQAMVKGNNVDGLAAGVAAIYLDSGTSNCTVVGSGKKTNVLDEGINNTLVGVNNMNGNSPGPAIREAMKRKMEMIKSLRKW